MYPTLLDLCGLPENKQNDGNSLRPLLENPKAKWKHHALTVYGVGNLSIRSRTHRYIRYEDGSEELYDMVKDPNEWSNQANNPEYSAIKARLKAALPEKQEPLSPKSSYTINEYWRAKVKESKGN
jgi:arylsulfatase A-like enzyme